MKSNEKTVFLRIKKEGISDSNIQIKVDAVSMEGEAISPHEIVVLELMGQKQKFSTNEHGIAHDAIAEFAYVQNGIRKALVAWIKGAKQGFIKYDLRITQILDYIQSTERKKQEAYEEHLNTTEALQVLLKLEIQYWEKNKMFHKAKYKENFNNETAEAKKETHSAWLELIEAAEKVVNSACFENEELKEILHQLDLCRKDKEYNPAILTQIVARAINGPLHIANEVAKIKGEIAEADKKRMEEIVGESMEEIAE